MLRIARHPPSIAATPAPLTMLLLGISLVLSLLSLLHARDIPKLPNCEEPLDTGNEEECARPVEDVVAVVPGSHYVAKIECKDCPYSRYKKGTGKSKSEVVKGDHILVCSVQLPSRH
jgi:hypothetical protein